MITKTACNIFCSFGAGWGERASIHSFRLLLLNVPLMGRMGRSMLSFSLSSTAWLILVMRHLNKHYCWWQKKKKNAWNQFREKEKVHRPQQEKIEGIVFGGFQPDDPICWGILGEVSEARNIFFHNWAIDIDILGLFTSKTCLLSEQWKENVQNTHFCIIDISLFVR